MLRSGLRLGFVQQSSLIPKIGDRRSTSPMMSAKAKKVVALDHTNQSRILKPTDLVPTSRPRQPPYRSYDQSTFCRYTIEDLSTVFDRLHIMVKHVLCGYGIDVDAVSNWLNTQNGTLVDETNVSRGVFGATVGTDRLLTLLEKYKIKASWYVPAHSLESFPKQMAKVRDAGHEMLVVQISA